MFLTHDHQLWANPTMEIDPTKIGIAGDVRLCIVYSAKLPAVPAKIIIIQIPDYPFMSHTSNCHVPTMFQSFDHNFLQNHHLFILVHHKILENQHLAPLSVLIFPIDHCSNVSPGGKNVLPVEVDISPLAPPGGCGGLFGRNLGGELSRQVADLDTWDI